MLIRPNRLQTKHKLNLRILIQTSDFGYRRSEKSPLLSIRTLQHFYMKVTATIYHNFQRGNLNHRWPATLPHNPLIALAPPVLDRSYVTLCFRGYHTQMFPFLSKATRASHSFNDNFSFCSLPQF
jgi:phosphoribulokinase